MKKFFISFIVFLFSSLILPNSWKISLNTSYQTLNLDDLEAPKGFWNIALINTVNHKNELGANIEVPEKIEGIYSSPAIGFSLEREIKFFLIKFGIDKFHKGYNPEFHLGSLDTNYYEVNNIINEAIDILSPYLSAGLKLLKTKYLNMELNLTGFLNLVEWEYSSDFNLEVLDSDSREKIIDVSEKNYTKISKLIPSLMPSVKLSLAFNKIGISIEGGYNIGKSSDIGGDIDYVFSMKSAFHNPIYYEYTGHTKIWVGETWVELMGYEYWVSSHLYGDEKPQQNPKVRKVNPAQIKFNNLFIKIAITYFF